MFLDLGRKLEYLVITIPRDSNRNLLTVRKQRQPLRHKISTNLIRLFYFENTPEAPDLDQPRLTIERSRKYDKYEQRIRVTFYHGEITIIPH